MNILFRPTGGPSSSLTSISTAPKGHLIVCGTMGGQILLIDSKSGKMKQDLVGHDGAISAVSFTGKPSSIVSCGWDKTTRLWNTKRSQEPILLKHGSEVKALSISAPLSKGASGARDGEVKVFSLTSLKCLRNLQAHRTDVSGIA
ncbi:MAG: WD40 repeat domain-containing protein, partial [Promethearchaeota archaeon]